MTAGCPPLSSLVPLHFPSHVLCFSSPAALDPHIPCCFMLACPCFDFTLPSVPAPSSWLGHRLLLTQMALVRTHSFIPRTLIAACKVSDVTAGCCHLPPPPHPLQAMWVSLVSAPPISVQSSIMILFIYFFQRNDFKAQNLYPTDMLPISLRFNLYIYEMGIITPSLGRGLQT